jgi:hypothetical protein
MRRQDVGIDKPSQTQLAGALLVLHTPRAPFLFPVVRRGADGFYRSVVAIVE